MVHVRKPPFALALTMVAMLCSSDSFGQHIAFEGLGDLPGGIQGSFASDVSADGTVVVGIANVAFIPGLTDLEAFRWTRSAGMIGLGDLPGGEFNSDKKTVGNE